MNAPPVPPETAATVAVLAEIWSSPAFQAFADKRVDQYLRHGHTPASDRALPLDRLLREARARIDGVLEILGPAAARIPPDRADVVMTKTAIAGALLMAAWDRLVVAVPLPLIADQKGEEAGG